MKNLFLFLTSVLVSIPTISSAMAKRSPHERQTLLTEFTLSCGRSGDSNSYLFTAQYAVPQVRGNQCGPQSLETTTAVLKILRDGVWTSRNYKKGEYSIVHKGGLRWILKERKRGYTFNCTMPCAGGMSVSN